MGRNLIEKIVAEHLVRGEIRTGAEVVVRVDQTLSHDLSSIIVAQIMEAVDADRATVDKAVFYCDHNVLCTVEDNSDDHYYMRTAAERFGVWFSKPGNGICHTVHCERFAAPGAMIVGGDSHTPTSGAVGALAIGTGGANVAMAALGEGFRFRMPRVMAVRFHGRLRPGTAAKDAALEILRRLSVKGGLGYILEYSGDGVEHLSLTERMTIANMSIETGATSGVFVSDAVTQAFLADQGRGEAFRPLAPDADAVYDAELDIDLSALQPLTACPSSPDAVVPVAERREVVPGSVFIGSCTNSSYADIARAAAVMRGRHVAPGIDCVIAPGSHPIYERLLADGAIETLVRAGCRILECACGPCIGVGQVPRKNGVTVRTSNRNFPGRCGSPNGLVYLVSPETAAATAVSGHMAEALELVDAAALEAVYTGPLGCVNDSLLLPPLPDAERRGIRPVRGPNVSELPMRGAMRACIDAAVVIRLGDNITTDDIIPGGTDIIRNIANVPAFAEYTFCYTDPDFVRRAKALGHSIIVGGENYGQGSSREQAAILPMYLGVEAVIAKSYARIHKENLINYGILPLLFTDDGGYEAVQQGDALVIENVLEGIDRSELTVRIPARGVSFRVTMDITDDDRAILKAGGVLNRLSRR